MAQMPAKMTFTIPEAIELAWRNNIQSISQRDLLRDAIALKKSTRTTFLPNISLNTGWERSSPKSIRTIRTVDSLGNIEERDTVTQDLYYYGFSLSQPLFNSRSGSYVHLPKSAQAGVHRSEQDLRSTRQSVALEVKMKCYDLLKAQMLLDVQKRAVERSAEQLETSQARFDLGSASMSDYLKSKVQLGNDSLLLISRENAAAIKRAELNDFLGLPVDRPTEIDAMLDFEPYPLPSVQARTEAVSAHPDVMSASYSMEASGHSLANARWSRLPSVDLVADYGWGGTSFPDSLEDVHKFDRASFGVQISYTLFSGYSTSSRIDQAKIERHRAESQLAQVKRTVQLAIKTASLTLDEARKRYHVSEEQVRSAQEDFNIAQEKYNLGAATILDVLDAQFSLSEAETGKIEAVFDYNLAVAELEKAMGGGD
jgi:outer membrane protein TolC